MRSLIALMFIVSILSCGGNSNGSDTAGPLTVGLPAAIASDSLVFDSDRTGNHEIFMMKTDGSGAKALTSDTSYENWWPRISPDRKKVLFYRAPKGKSESYVEASLWVVNADGTALTQLRAKGADGWALQGHGEWSPDGGKIAMFGTASGVTQIFVTDAQGKNAVQYTNRTGVTTDVSWSPDGTKLLFNGCPTSTCAPADYEIYVMPATPLATATRLTTNTFADYDPYFSPDGTSIAWLSNVDPTAFPTPAGNLGKWAIRIANADGTNVVTNARDLINDGQVNSKPAWSLDGQTIYFHRMVPTDYRFRVFRIGKDSTGLKELTFTTSGNDEYPSN